MSKRILLVEDEENFGDVLKSYLEMNDYEVILATDGDEGLDAFNANKIDLCILDVMMPKKDGFTLGKEIKEKSPDTPLIFLTAKTMKEDEVQGFQIGAEDYIKKPFNSEILLYRVQAILKRASTTKTTKTEPQEYTIGNFTFNFPLRVLSGRDGKKEKLSPKEAALLKMFATKIF